MGDKGGGSYINAPIQISVDGGDSASVLDNLVTRFTENKNKLEQIGKEIDKSISPSLKSAATSAQSLFQSLTALNNLSFTTTIANLTSLEGKLASVQSQALRTAESLARTGAVPINNSIIVPPGSSRGTSPSVTPGLARGSLYIQDARGRFRDVRGRFATPPVLFEPSQSPINTLTSGRAYGRDLRNPQEVAIALAYRQARDAGQLTPELQIDLAQKFAQARWPRLAGLPSSIGVGQLPGTANAQYDPGTRSIMMRPGGTGDFNPFRTLPHELRHAFDYQRPAGFANSLKKQYGTWWEDKEIEAAGRSVIESRGSRAGSVGENAFRRAVTASTNLNRNDLRQIFTNPEMLKEFTGATSDFTGAPALFEKAGTGPIASARRMRPPKGIIPSVIQPNPEYIFMGREAIEALTPAKLRKPRPGQLNRAVWQQRIEDTNNQVYDVTTDIEYGLQKDARGRWQKQEKSRKEIVQRLEQDEKTGLYRRARVAGSTLVEKPTVYQFAQGRGQLTDYLVSDVEKRGGGRIQQYVSTDPSGKTFQTKRLETAIAGGSERPLSTTTRTLDPAANLWKTKTAIDATTKAMIDGEKKSDGYHGSLRRHMRYMVEGTLLYATFGAAIYGVQAKITETIGLLVRYDSVMARVNIATRGGADVTNTLVRSSFELRNNLSSALEVLGTFEQALRFKGGDLGGARQLTESALSLQLLSGGQITPQKGLKTLVALRSQIPAIQSDQQIGDLAAVAYQYGIEIDDFVEALREGAGAMRAGNMPLAEYASLTTLMAQRSGESASEIGTTIGMLSERFRYPEVQSKLGAMGIGVYANAEGTEYADVVDVMRKLREEFDAGRITSQQLDDALTALFGPRLARRGRNLIDVIDELDAAMRKFENSAGEAQKMQNQLGQTAEVKWQNVGKAWEQLVLTMSGGVDPVKQFLDFSEQSLKSWQGTVIAIQAIPGLLKEASQTDAPPWLKTFAFLFEGGQKTIDAFSWVPGTPQFYGRTIDYFTKDTTNKSETTRANTIKKLRDDAIARGEDPDRVALGEGGNDLLDKGALYGMPGTYYKTDSATKEAEKKLYQKLPWDLSFMREYSSSELDGLVDIYKKITEQYPDVAKQFPETTNPVIWSKEGSMWKYPGGQVNDRQWQMAQTIFAEKMEKSKNTQIEKMKDYTPAMWQKLPGLISYYQNLYSQIKPELAKPENQRMYYFLDKNNQIQVQQLASSEAIQAAVEEINETNKKLEGTYNIPGSYQAWMPQNWAPGYYAITGSTKKGPVNYPDSKTNTQQTSPATTTTTTTTSIVTTPTSPATSIIPTSPAASITPTSPATSIVTPQTYDPALDPTIQSYSLGIYDKDQAYDVDRDLLGDDLLAKYKGRSLESTVTDRLLGFRGLTYPPSGGEPSEAAKNLSEFDLGKWFNSIDWLGLLGLKASTAEASEPNDLLYRGKPRTVDQVPKIPLGSLTPSSPNQMSVARSITSDLTKSPESTTYLSAITRNTGIMVQQLGAIEGALNGIDIKIANMLGRMMDSKGGGMSNGGVNSSGTLGNTSGSPYSGGW